jgi:hypothetical protein
MFEVLGQSTSMPSVRPPAEMMGLIATIVPLAVGGLLALSGLCLGAVIVLSRKAFSVLKA